MSDTPDSNGDYVLGTSDVELKRLALQHEVWRDVVLAAWRDAGLRPGMRVLDVGAGPGYATLDLARIVGASGHVTAVERSARFVAHLRHAVAGSQADVEVIHSDLMEAGPLPPEHDFAWCRWVACFVQSPARLVDWIAGAMRPGGRAVFHEYSTYESWRFFPARPRLEEFVRQVMTTWRADGGEPNIAPTLARLLRDAGLRIVSIRPHLFVAAPGEPFWRWPASFVHSNVDRLMELGHVEPEWADAVRAELDHAERAPESRMITPLVAEIVAEL